MSRKIKVGLYGTNGHQVHKHLCGHADAELAAVAAFAPDAIPGDCTGVTQYGTLDELIADPQIELVSLCSPLRRDQAADAVRCMQAGKHVYAEKPSALAEDELDDIIRTAAETGKQYHEMAGTIVQRPYMQMREAIRSGAIGTVVQVLAQKCYPWYDHRPADEDMDGGLGVQAGVYVLRFVEHIAGVRVASLATRETRLGNPIEDSQCRRAVSFLMTLENGGVASGIANYLNPMSDRLWGYEIVRVFGTEGIIESNADGDVARLLRQGEPPVALDTSAATVDYFDLYIQSLLGDGDMPLALEEELSPTRWVVRAKYGGDRLAI